MEFNQFVLTAFILEAAFGDTLKGCVCYIFASLFCMSKREYL